jgi:hypothetical protein
MSAKSKYLDAVSPRREFHHIGMSISQASRNVNVFYRSPTSFVIFPSVADYPKMYTERGGRCGRERALLYGKI